MKLVAAFYDVNQGVFSDSREQHMAEATAHLRACSASWHQELSIAEQTAIRGLPDRYVEAFRICRDLAALQVEVSEPGRFFISYRELSDRIGTTDKEAQKILKAFEGQKWIEILEKGTQHKPGARGKATFYGWLLASSILLFSFHPLFYSTFIQHLLSIA